MVGMNIFGRTNDGKWIPQYMNFSISERSPNKDFKIQRNILEDTVFFYDSTVKILNQISEIYIERMNKDHPCIVTFFGEDEIEFREVSYNEFISGQKGKLIQFPVRRK